jgi:3-dehydroquinate dehydratase II
MVLNSTRMRIDIINGPNLNLLGVREPSVYGDISFDVYLDQWRAEFSDIDIQYFQSNHEGYLIDRLHEVGFTTSGILLNAGGLSHQSISIADAIKAISAPVIEIHISNVQARESFRHQSLIAPNCRGQITGLGLDSYTLGLLYFRRLMSGML